MHRAQSTNLLLQPARPGEEAWIALMSRELIEHGLPWSWTPRRVARHIADPESVVLTARLDGRRAGFAIMGYGEQTAHLNLLAVAPGCRRRGVARRMLGWLEKSAFVAGTFLVSVEVRAGNRAARTLYRRLGFREVAQMRGYYFRIEDAIRLTHDLRPRRRRRPET